MMGGFKSEGKDNPAFGIWDANNADKSYSHGYNKALLREIHRCKECKKKFLSLYTIKECLDHTGELEWKS
jgi:hypothetical protein